MKCNTVRKFLYAFADGQLSVRANCEVLDHLKMCPGCSRLVDKHQSLRAAIGRSISKTPVPPRLQANVLAALKAGEPSNRNLKPAFAPTRRFFITPRLAVASLAAAASLALLVTIGWRAYVPVEQPVPTTASPPVTVERGQIAASLVAEIHQTHSEAGAAHHNKALPASLDRVGPAIARHFGDRLAVDFPNLSDYDFEFESANFCGVRDMVSEDGGHVVYASTRGEAKLSFFVVPRYDRLDMAGARAAFGAYREYEIEQADGPPLAVLAWHHDETTFVCCGALNINRLKVMVGAIRTAMPDFDRNLKLACARLHQMHLVEAAPHTH